MRASEYQQGCPAIHWVKNNWFFRGILCSLAAIIVAAIARALIGGITFKMIYEALINLDIFYVLEGIFVILLVVFSVLFVRQQCKNSIDKKEEEKKHLESKIEDMITKYNELFEKTKPPHSNIDSLIKAEVKCDYGTVRVLPDDLRFDIQVINRTNYRFLCKDAFLVCYHNAKSLFTEKWKEGMPIAHIVMSDLERLVGGSIQFDVPIEEIEIQKIDNCRELMLSVNAKYTTEEDIVHDTPDKSVKVESMHLNYGLDEETISKLKGWRERHEAR